MSLAKVLIVEDDIFLRSTLTSLLALKGFEVVGQVDTAEEAIILQKLHNPEVLLIDLDLGPGPNGIEIAIELRANNPRLGIIILTSFSDPRLANTRKLELPHGTIYLTKSRVHDVSVLITSILRVKHSPHATHKRSHTQFSQLTETQIEILRLVSEGQTTSSIAQQRGVSEKSVEFVLARTHAVLNLPRNNKLNPRVQLTRAYFALSGKKPPGE